MNARDAAVSQKMCYPSEITMAAVTESQQLVHYSLSKLPQDLSLGDIITTDCPYSVQLQVKLGKIHKLKWSCVML